jgi:hypothetical protein
MKESWRVLVMCIIKSILKITFLMKTSETKKFVETFCEAFLIFKKYFAQAIKDLFSYFTKNAFKIPKQCGLGLNVSG